MKKFVFLKIGSGDFADGFPVTLKIASRDRNSILEVEIESELPSNAQILEIYKTWIRDYTLLSHIPLLAQQCYDCAKELKSQMRTWLSSSNNLQFYRVRETLCKYLDPADEIFVFLQTREEILKKLPWHEWDLFSDRFTKAEIALSPPEIEFISRSRSQIRNEKVKILSILGDKTGIDINKDLELIKNLPDADSEFLIEPNRQQFSDRLWERNWDIFFFSGHSSSENESGIIYLNPEDRLPIEDLKNGLRRAIDNGLELAIFNSCDGLRLAEYLAELNIPQIIVMREPVEDRIAQLFLEYFLQAYSGGEPLYLAVRQARSRLEAIEKEIPGATWIPIIYQNSIQEPVTWPKSQKSKDYSTTDLPILFIPPDTNNQRQIWRCDRTLEEHSDHVTAVAIHPNGKTFATGSRDKRIILWDLETGKVKKTCAATPNVIRALAFSPDSSVLVSASSMEFQDGTIKLWDADNLTLRQILDSGFLSLGANDLAFSRDGQYLAIGHYFPNSSIKIWHLPSGKLRFTLRDNILGVWSLIFNKDGQILVSGGEDGAIRIWNWKAEQLIRTLRPEPSNIFNFMLPWIPEVELITDIAIDPDNNIIVSGSVSNGLKFWDVNSGNCIRTLQQNSGCIEALALSPNDNTLVSIGKDGIIRLWNIKTGELLHTLKGHKDSIKDIAFTPDGKTLISVSDDRTVKIWRYS